MRALAIVGLGLEGLHKAKVTGQPTHLASGASRAQPADGGRREGRRRRIYDHVAVGELPFYSIFSLSSV